MKGFRFSIALRPGRWHTGAGFKGGALPVQL